MAIKAGDLAGMSWELDGTVHDLLGCLNSMTPKTKRESFLRIEIDGELYDPYEIGFAQSDQAESHILKVYIKARP